VLLFTVYGWTGFVNACDRLCLGSSGFGTSAEAIAFLRAGAAFALICGFLGTLIGLVIMLCSMSEAEALGPAMATAILSQFWGVLLAIGLFVAAMIISRRRANEDMVAHTRGAIPAASLAAGLGTLALILCFLILLLAMAGL
jgi:hypothetical protein